METRIKRWTNIRTNIPARGYEDQHTRTNIRNNIRNNISGRGCEQSESTDCKYRQLNGTTSTHIPTLTHTQIQSDNPEPMVGITDLSYPFLFQKNMNLYL